MINFDTFRKRAGLNCRVVTEWEHEGHDVALVALSANALAPANNDELHLICGCDIARLNKESIVSGVPWDDPQACPARAAIRKQVISSCKSEYRLHWKELGLKVAVNDIFERYQKGQYFGQRAPSLLFCQDVATLLEIDLNQIHSSVTELVCEEKLDLNGMILIPHEERLS